MKETNSEMASPVITWQLTLNYQKKGAFLMLLLYMPIVGQQSVIPSFQKVAIVTFQN